jgi:hypothetical protein
METRDTEMTDSELRDKLEAIKLHGDADYCTHKGDTIYLGEKAIDQILTLFHQHQASAVDELEKKAEDGMFDFDNGDLPIQDGDHWSCHGV